jgi:zinc/manganese transport system substrate-binding protein
MFMPMNLRPRMRLLFLALLLVASRLAAADTLDVVASFSILGDITQRIGGPRVQVHTLVGQDADAHVYQPTPADAKTIARARLVIVNGFGFEGWIERLISSSGYRGQVVIASSGINVLKRPHPAAGKTATHAPDSGVDPHAWQDLANGMRYVDNIALALSQTDPAGKTLYQANATRYKQEMATLDAEIRQSFAAIPAARRKIVTSHDAFGYFSRAYGIAFISPIGVNTDGEPSAADVGRIIRQIRREKITAVFMESYSDQRLLERIRLESGARIGGTLYSDSLSRPNGPAATYLQMMQHNARTLEAALSD